MTKLEVLEYIKEEVTGHNKSPGEYGELDAPAGVQFEEVHSQGGGEGEGEHVEVVLKVTLQDGSSFYVMCTGYYSSYEGTDWSYGDTYEVTPYQKEITAWKQVK